MKRLSAIIIVMMLIVAIPTETFAVSKPSQVKNLKASAKTTSSITLKWNKVKAAKGYEVQQYNPKTKKWKTLKKVKVLNYKHTKLKANTSYKYRVRAYKTYKQYYNSKTKKWQNKKPAKKNWKNKKTRTKYVYGKASKTVSVRTKKKTTTSNTGSGNTPSSNPTSTSDGSTTESIIDYSDYTDDDARLNLRVTRAANRSVTLVWDALQGAKHYTVKAGDSITTTESTSITLNNLPKNKSTLFEVQAEKYKNGKLYCFSNSCSVSVRFYDDYYTESGFHYDNEVHLWADYCSEKNMIDIPKKGTYTAKDYKGEETTYEVVEGGYGKSSTKSHYVIYKTLKPSEDCTIDGEWKQRSGAWLCNCSGATFDLTTFPGYDGKIEGYMSDGGDCSHGYAFTVYNLDPNKLQVIPKDASIEAVNTYSSDRNPVPETHYYYVKNGYRISKAPGANTSFVYCKKGNGSEYAVVIPFHCSPNGIGWGVGFKLMTIDFEIKYDGKTIGTITADPREANYQDKSKIKLNEPDPVRKKCIEIVNNAFEDNPMTFDIYEDMITLINYINDTYEYEECIYDESGNRLFYMNCAGGALCLETYAIKYQGEYGFATPRGNLKVDTHRSFSINSKPDIYWSAQGGK